MKTEVNCVLLLSCAKHNWIVSTCFSNTVHVILRKTLCRYRMTVFGKTDGHNKLELAFLQLLVLITSEN